MVCRVLVLSDEQTNAESQTPCSHWTTGVPTELRRLGLLAGSGPASCAATHAGMLEAFGDDRWCEMGEPLLLDRLRAGRAPRNLNGPHRPRYAALAARGVVECVIGLGFDNALPAGDRIAQLGEQLRRRGYAEGPAQAAPLLAKSNRPRVPAVGVTYFSRPDGMRLRPPAGPSRTVPVVVGLVANTDGYEDEAAAARFLDGLRQASVCMYAGHWRYGLGADFGAGPAVHTGTAHLSADARRLIRAAAGAARAGEPAEAVLDRWLDEDLIRIIGTNAGKVVLAHRNVAPGSFAGRLANWAARRAPGGLAPPAIDLSTAGDQLRCPRHRLWFFLSCRSASSFASLRRTLSVGAVRLVGLHGAVRLREWRVLPWVLDAICAGGGWPELTSVIDPSTYGSGLVADGWQDDPVVS